VRICHRLKKAGECGYVPCESFVEDFLLEIITCVRAKGTAVVPVEKRTREHSSIQDLKEINFSYFLGGEREELKTPGSPPEEVGPATFELPGARSRKHEPEPLVLHEPMNLVQERRHLLDLVDDDRLGSGFLALGQDFFPQEGGTAAELEVAISQKEVEPDTVRETSPKVRGLPRLTWPPKEG
jgi:hypothetical protein